METQGRADPQTRIRQLNDQFRKLGIGNGSTMITPGIMEKGHVFMMAALLAVRTFNDFTNGNDPYGEHDFGAFTMGGERLFFKLDYTIIHPGPFAQCRRCSRHHRVLTIMLASEY
ncbi:MAG: DUF3768 domain-containing protein [Sphingomonadales bacterium]|nr:DUF3768 domain-containing protein [Sphingomonadales bacterium]